MAGANSDRRHTGQHQFPYRRRGKLQNLWGVALYIYQVSDLVFNKIEDGQYTQFTLRFIDALVNPIYMQDPNKLILLIIKSKEE